MEINSFREKQLTVGLEGLTSSR